MDEDPLRVKSRRWHSAVGIALPLVGIVLPLCLLIGVWPRVLHDRVVVTGEEVTLVLFCSLLFLIIQLVAFVYGLAIRHTLPGRIAVGLSGILLVVSTILFAWVLTIRLDRRNTPEWLKGAPFWLIETGVLLVVSFVLFALFRAKWTTAGGDK